MRESETVQRFSPPAARIITKFPSFPPSNALLCSALFFFCVVVCRRPPNFTQTAGPPGANNSIWAVIFSALPSSFRCCYCRRPCFTPSRRAAFFASLFTIRRNRRPSLSPEAALDYVEDNENSSVTHLGAIHSFDQFAHNTSACDNSPHLVARINRGLLDDDYNDDTIYSNIPRYTLFWISSA